MEGVSMGRAALKGLTGLMGEGKDVDVDDDDDGVNDDDDSNHDVAD